MIKVFNSTDKTYSTNGNIVLKPTIANVHKEDNGDFYLDLETIFDEKEVKIQPEAGTIVSSQDASLTITDANTLKEVELTNIQGNTTQSGTPTPSTPQPINVVSGEQDIVVAGKNLFDLTNIVNNGTGRTTYTIENDNIVMTATSSGTYRYIYKTINNLTIGQEYTIKINYHNDTSTNKIAQWGVVNSQGNYYVYVRNLKDYQKLTFTPTETSATFRAGYLGNSCNQGDILTIGKIQLEKGNTATTYEEYKGQSYEINLGKNLWNTEFERAEYNSSGVKVSTNVWLVNTTKINVIPNTTYTISQKEHPIQYRIICFNGTTYLSQFSSSQNTTTGLSSYTFTTPNNCNGIYIQFRSTIERIATGTYTVEVGDITQAQLEKGSVASSYSPYKTPIELCKIGEYQDFIKKGTGKNLYSGGDTLTKQFTYMIPSKIGKTYTLSFKGSTTGSARIFFRNYEDEEHSSSPVDSEVVFLTSTMSDYSLTITSTINGYLFIATSGSISGYTFQQIQLEESSSATSYEPYGMYNKWYIEKQIGKVVLDGSETMSVEKTGTANWYYNITKPTGINVDSTPSQNNAMCNYYPIAAVGNSNTNQGIYVVKDSGKIRIRYGTEDTTTNFKNWLSTHNTSVYYVLATPTYTEITDSELIGQLNALRLLEGLNNISISSGDLAGEITIHYNYLDAASESIRYVDYLVPNNIVVANTPQGEQAFRITNVEKTKRKIKIKAYHVFYDTENYLIQDSYVVDKNCNDALDHLNNATSDTSPFTTISNITTIDSYRCVRKSLFEAIQVVIERWGGHLVRNNWTIGVYDTIGQDNGVVIRYAKNLKEITASYNWDEVVTKLLPVGKDGILLNAIDPTASVYVESTTQYDIPYTKTLSFSQDNISEDDYKDEEGNLNENEYKQALVNDLMEKGQSYVQDNSIPKVNYTLSANVEKVSDIGDTIEVIDEKLGINIMTNIISYDYDCILDKYIELEFGNFTPTLSGLMETITTATEKIVEEGTNNIKITLDNDLKEATDKIWNALGNSYVIYEGDKILVVDSLPKETATNVIMINNGGIGFSNTGITGTFNSAWTIDNVLNMEQINVINMTADLIKGGTLKLGNNLNQNGQIEVYDEANTLIAELNKNGLKMYGVDGSYVLMNNQVGFSGYDRNDNPIYWVNGDEFHMKKSVIEEEITLCNKMRFIPITITDGNNQIVNDGIGLVSVLGGGN